MGRDLLVQKSDGGDATEFFSEPGDVFIKFAMRHTEKNEYEAFKELDLERLYDHPVVNTWTVSQVKAFLEAIQLSCPGGKLEEYFQLLVKHELEIHVF